MDYWITSPYYIFHVVDYYFWQSAFLLLSFSYHTRVKRPLTSYWNVSSFEIIVSHVWPCIPPRSSGLRAAPLIDSSATMSTYASYDSRLSSGGFRKNRATRGFEEIAWRLCFASFRLKITRIINGQESERRHNLKRAIIAFDRRVHVHRFAASQNSEAADNRRADKPRSYNTFCRSTRQRILSPN